MSAVLQYRSEPTLSAGPALRQPRYGIVSTNIVFWRLMSPWCLWHPACQVQTKACSARVFSLCLYGVSHVSYLTSHTDPLSPCCCWRMHIFIFCQALYLYPVYLYPVVLADLFALQSLASTWQNSQSTLREHLPFVRWAGEKLKKKKKRTFTTNTTFSVVPHHFLVCVVGCVYSWHPSSWSSMWRLTGVPNLRSSGLLKPQIR